MKKLYLLILSIFVLMSFSCAFASDANETIINHDVNVDGSVPIMIDGNNSVDNTIGMLMLMELYQEIILRVIQI